MRRGSFIVCLLFAVYSCDFYDYRLTIINNTGSSICVETFHNAEPVSDELNQTEYYLSDEITSNTNRKLMETGRNGWEDRIDKSPNKKLNLVVFKIDSIKKYGNINYLLENKIYDLYTFSKKELEEKKWKISIDH